ncbi:MAG TPA: hypothetical protein DIT35_05185 [Rhodospirillaceae bacterium]|nr:hypothetical protein [Rhodospirillaceae bacterium]
MDSSHNSVPDFRHRALGPLQRATLRLNKTFGRTITKSAAKEVSTELIAEQDVQEDCMGNVPTMADWFRAIVPKKGRFSQVG